MLNDRRLRIAGAHVLPIVCAAAFALFAFGAMPSGAAQRAGQRASTAPLLPPAGTVYFGAFVNFLKKLGPYETQTAAFEQQIGRTLAIHAEYYYDWTETFPDPQQTDDYNHGRIPVISWDCGAPPYDIAIGQQDSVIVERAKAVKAYGHPLFLRYFWEMNLPYAVEDRPECIDPVHDENGYANPKYYIAAWDRIRAIFAAQGVTNVVWLWCPSGSQHVSPLLYYPGSSETDWVCFDHYDLDGTLGVYDTLAVPYGVLLPLGKPMMVGETGTTPSEQWKYLTSAPGVLQSDFPDIRGIMYFDAYGHRQDWRLSPAGIAGFKSAGESAYFSGFAPR